MKIKNLTIRNIKVLGTHLKQGGTPFKVNIPAGSTVELTDEQFWLIRSTVLELRENGVLQITEEPVVNLSKEQLIELVYKKTGVQLPIEASKDDLQVFAQKLEVDIIGKHESPNRYDTKENKVVEEVEIENETKAQTTSDLNKDEIIKKVKLEKDIDLGDDLKKVELIAEANKLGVKV